MEKNLEDSIKKFLAVSDGSGDGSGYGYGDGDGYGYGYGYGDGDGDGSGDGYGSGSGSGSGIPEFNGKKVYQIDGVPTIIEKITTVELKKSPVWQFAEGFILQSDFTLTPCFIAKIDNCFAHGETLRQAITDATSKALERMPLEDRINKFKEKYPDADVKIPARELYDWHHTLTGSCTMGRDNFAKEHNIDVDKDEFTIREFIALTCKSYGSDIIIKLAEAYGIENYDS